MIAIQVEKPDKPEIVRMIEQLDRYLISLYPPESNHLLDIQALMRDDIVFVTAKESGRYVGCGAIRKVATEYAEVKRMYVVPKARGRNVGRKILDELERQSLKAGFKTLRLETGVNQPEAMALYRGAGFTQTGPFGEYKPDPLSLFFEKRIG